MGMRWISREPREAIRAGGDCALTAPGRHALRDSGGNASRRSSPNDLLGTLTGHFAVFNQWAEINSREGNFMETVLPGAFTKTMAENRSMRCIFQHGQDPQAGLKPLGNIVELHEDQVGAYYEVELYDTSYGRAIAPGLRSGCYGASFRFQVQREEVVTDPLPSPHNPDAIEERKIAECKVAEFGPVTFPAYKRATAALRSRTIERQIFERMRMIERDAKELGLL
jgi:HK97 family phage prohead protease